MHTLLTRSVCRNFIDPSFNSLLINVPWPWSASLSHLFIKFIKNICGNSECASLAHGRLWELQPDLTALKSHSFSINRQLIQKIGAHITVQCDFWSVRILYCFSHRCVFYGGKFRILSTFDSSKNDAIKSKKINNYAMLHSQHYHLCLCVCVSELSYSPFRIYLQLKPFIIMSLSTTARANQRKMDQTNGHQQNKVPTEEFFTRFFFFRFLCLSARHTRTTHRIHSLVLPRQKGKNILAACE